LSPAGVGRPPSTSRTQGGTVMGWTRARGSDRSSLLFQPRKRGIPAGPSARRSAERRGRCRGREVVEVSLEPVVRVEGWVLVQNKRRDESGR